MKATCCQEMNVERGGRIFLPESQLQVPLRCLGNSEGGRIYRPSPMWVSEVFFKNLPAPLSTHRFPESPHGSGRCSPQSVPWHRHRELGVRFRAGEQIFNILLWSLACQSKGLDGKVILWNITVRIPFITLKHHHLKGLLANSGICKGIRKSDLQCPLCTV